MNTDIRLYVTFKAHRKRRKLRTLLGDNSTDYLIDLWLTAAQDRPDGVLTGWTDTDTALAAGWDGDAKTFINALLECGLLEEHDGCYTLHDWQEHQPWACNAEERSERARNAANARYGKCKTHAGRMQDACKPQCSEHAPSPSPSPIPTPIVYSQKDAPSGAGKHSEDVKRVFDCWNDAGIIKHRKLDERIRRAINGVLANYSADEVCAGIANYKRILDSPQHMFTYKWTLQDFLRRGLEKFLDWKTCDDNYRNGGGNGRGLPGNQPSGAFAAFHAKVTADGDG